MFYFRTSFETAVARKLDEACFKVFCLFVKGYETIICFLKLFNDTK